MATTTRSPVASLACAVVAGNTTRFISMGDELNPNVVFGSGAEPRVDLSTKKSWFMAMEMELVVVIFGHVGCRVEASVS